MEFSFDAFCLDTYDWDPINKRHTGLMLHRGGRDCLNIRIEDIDKLNDFPDVDTVKIVGLRQDTFEYFIRTFGHQLKAINFHHFKLVEDWSLLGSLTQIRYLKFFSNQRIDRLWDMSGNRALTGLSIEDFSRFKNINLIDTAPALEDFRIGNAIWSKMVIDSFTPLERTPIRHFEFSGKNVLDKDLTFLNSMHNLQIFDFPTNLFTTEEVAWIAANFPQITGCAITPYTGYPTEERPEGEGWIVGKRKPYLKYAENEEKIRKYERSFEELKQKYKGISYREAFLDG